MISYILKTLQTEDHVFIERLGAFRMQLRHAVIEGNIIRPPYNEVVFSQTDSEENNFALANLISREKQCLFTYANEEITAWVSELLAALQNNKSVTYEDFGTFMLDKKGNITFESALIPQLNSQFEGLESIDLKHFEVAAVPVVEPEPVVNPEPVVEPEPETISEPVETFPETSPHPEPETESVVEPEPVVNPEPIVEPEPETIPEPVETFPETSPQPEPEKKKHHLAWLWILLLLIAVGAALGFVFKDKLLGYYHQWQEKKQTVEQVVEPQETPDATATIDEEIEPAEPAEEPQEEVKEPEPEVFTPTVIKQSSDGKYDYIRFEKGHYYAIAGSFPTEADVIRHIHQKKLDQYSPRILKQDGVSNLRVCIGVFTTEEEAESFAKGVSTSYWVLK